MEGLAQKADRACIEHTSSELFLREGSYEYDRRVDTLRNQQVLQIGPAQSRHLHVRDQARGVVEQIGFEKFLSRCKGIGVQSERLDEPPRRVAHGNVIINNRNHGDLRHAGFLEGPSHEERDMEGRAGRSKGRELHTPTGKVSGLSPQGGSRRIPVLGMRLAHVPKANSECCQQH